MTWVFAVALALTASDIGNRLTAPERASPRQPASSVQIAAESLHVEIEQLIRGTRPEAVPASTWRRIVDVYRTREYASVWIDHRGVFRGVSAYLDRLAAADRHALLRSDYFVSELAALAGTTRQGASTDSLARLDVMLTASLGRYAEHMLTGRTDPGRVEPSWHIDANAVDVDSALQRILRADDFERALDQLTPKEDGYTTLVDALARYREIAERGAWPQVDAARTLRMGDTGSAIGVLRNRLSAEGFGSRPDSAHEAFDSSLASAVAEFQRRHGLVVDTLVGPATQRALNVTAQVRVEQIAINLERYRWLPRELGGRRIVVNIPAFRLEAFDGGERVTSMRVVVGSELRSRHTPVFSDSMSYVQFGPYWNVPRNIAVNEILPEARSDRSYLDRNHFEVVRGWGDDASVVNHHSLGWAQLTSTSYRIRQRPGPGNALGRVKFMFPNDFAVYLHDTPAQSLFDESTRAYSHGCVRVADPAALADFVLSRQDQWTPDRIQRTLESGQRVRVDLRAKVPVYLIYLTAFDLNGETAFREDLYDMDDALRSALGHQEPSGTEEQIRLLQRTLGSSDPGN